MVNCYKRLGKLKELIPTSLIDTVSAVPGKWANKPTERLEAIVQSKMTQLQHAMHKKTPQDQQKLGQEYFFPSMNYMNT